MPAWRPLVAVSSKLFSTVSSIDDPSPYCPLPVRRALSRQRKAPIQLFSYADDDICVARGRSGGLAVWARTTAEWELANGVV